MKAMVLYTIGDPLELRDIRKPEPAAHQLQLQVHTCGICRTDLHIHIRDGELKSQFAACIGSSNCGYSHPNRHRDFRFFPRLTR